ncbi:GPI mannosyltransferase 2 [Elysia marginata]|uniref:GPI mannosyltransferase 2 n=1 Tax=Elysia marginata TaxID=1093978 RepID=A0AAV4G9D7_9GAST|nr:GPI mannosyltransferase 2 [Elysia marginata]
MEAPVSSIVFFSVRSRLAVIIIQFASNLILPDHEADVFNPPVNTSSFTILDSAVHLALGGFRRWDAVYFTHIMQYGYSYENCAAFFPLFPWLVSSAGSLLFQLRILHFSSCILLTSVVLNFVLFVLTSFGLYKLGTTVLKDERIAYYSVLFFCINPASIFMTAPYSEVLYFCTLIYALNGLNAGAKYAASFLIGLGVFTRSNGLVGTAFVLHSIAKSFLASAYYLHSFHDKSNTFAFVRKITVLGFKTAQEVVVCTFLCVSPFAIYQYFIFLKFCESPSEIVEPSIAAYGRQLGYHLQGDKPSSWCRNQVPLSYSYIQLQHWGVGFLEYYTLKQVPNFLLALPIVCLSLRACYHFLSLDHQASLHLGLWDLRALSRRRTLLYKKVDSFEDEDCNGLGEVSRRGQLVESKRDDDFNNLGVPRSLQKLPSASDTVVYAFHLLSLVIFGLLFVHIQVLTRLLCSSSPLLYWYCGSLYVFLHRTQPELNNMSKLRSGQLASKTSLVLNKLGLHFLEEIFFKWPHLSRELKCIVVYFVGYLIVGTIMFSNFLPWT